MCINSGTIERSIFTGKVIVQGQGGQVKALLQSPAKTPQLQQQQVIVKQGTATPVVQKLNPANAVMVSGGQVFTGGQQQVVVSGNQVITSSSGQQVNYHRIYFKHSLIMPAFSVDHKSNRSQ